MRTKVIAALIMLMPAGVFADAMATAVTVFDAKTFRSMTATNAIGQVADGDLFTKSVFHSFFGSGGQEKHDVSAEFTWDHKSYRLFIGRRDTKTIYAVLMLEANRSARIVAVGEIPENKEAKADPNGDLFVVVVRNGNFRPQ